MTFRPWFQRVRAVLELTTHSQSRRWHGVAPLAAETEQFEPRCLLAAGALDSTFGIGGEKTADYNAGGFGGNGSSRDKGAAVVIQSDGKILVAGQFEGSRRGEYAFGVTRFNSNGTLDLTFGSGGMQPIEFITGAAGIYNKATGIAVQSNGKIVVVGTVTVPRNSSNNLATLPTVFGVARLNSTGTYDSTFDGDGRRTVTWGVGSSTATGVAIATDGKIIVAGYKSPNNSVSDDLDFAVARLKTDGSLDTTFSGDGLQTVAFDVGGGKGDVCNAMTLQTDGKIVLAGDATVNSSGDVDFAVARLTTSGILDNTFDGDGKRTFGFDKGGLKVDLCYAVTVSSGKIVLAGEAELAGNDYDFAVARLNSNGSLDSTFDGDGKRTFGIDLVGGNKSDGAKAVKVQSDGKIVVAGYASSVGFDSDYAVARLMADGSLDTTFGNNGKKTSGRSGDDQASALAIQSNGRLVIAGYSKINGTVDFAVARLTNS